MDEIVKMIQQRTGIEAGQARTAADTVVGFLKDRLPAPIASQIEDALDGGGEGQGDSPMDRVGSMFGGSRDRPSR